MNSSNKTETIKTLTRPVIAVMLVAGCLALVVMEMPVPDWLQVMTAGAVAWWFTDRTRRNEK